MLKCGKCSSEIPDTEERCPTCGLNVGPPNVRAASSPEEEQALENRYQNALALAVMNDCLPIVERFQASVEQTSAVLNVDLNFLHFFITSGSSLYVNYESGVRAGAFSDVLSEGSLIAPLVWFCPISREAIM
jgi:hypothetical protein